MSNSNLVDYKLLSPNCHKPRNKKIDTITIHHMAGNLTVETCGKIFQNTKREASSNYGIGTDGRIGFYVDEANRAWTSGSPANDHRAVTIEVANDGLADTNWHVSDKAMASLINLVADICKRNGIKKLVWSDNKEDRVGHKNGCNMTVHRDFQATACPGPYLMSKMPYIASEVNKKLAGATEAPKEPVKEEPKETAAPTLTYEQFKAYMNKYLEEKADEPASTWTYNEKTGFDPIGDVKKLELMVGDASGRFRPQSYVKREELASVVSSIIKRLKITL